ncbi:MAG: hypothetical protein COS20_01440 [Gallionellaceae bacterium CG02_land_8_20_14_3_00_60_115]|nr:MAG: hypothetical protein COS20_01440 [Gallionellaceae bacterium CG02_land_8_20_14_3_00_60_115]
MRIIKRTRGLRRIGMTVFLFERAPCYHAQVSIAPSMKNMPPEEINPFDIYDHLARENTVPESTSVWTEIGEAEVAHTLFGKARVRIRRRQDDARMAWRWTVFSIMLVGGAVWLVWTLAPLPVMRMTSTPAAEKIAPPAMVQSEPVQDDDKSQVLSVMPRVNLPPARADSAPVSPKILPPAIVIQSAPVDPAQKRRAVSVPAMAPAEVQPAIGSAVADSPGLQNPLDAPPASQPPPTTPLSN